MPPSPRRVLLSIVFIVAAVYLGLLLVLYLVQGRLLYFPTRALATTPAAIGLDFDDVWLTTEDGVRLHAWYVHSPDARGVILFLHGNAGNISHRLDSIRTFADLGMDVMIVDYRGYGRSEGRPSERGTYRDAAAAWSHLVEERGVAPGRIALFGRSLGGAVAAWLAERTDPAAIILESTFTSVPDLAADLYRWLPARLLVRFRYPTLERVPRLEMPVLVVHSDEDEIIPFHHGERLYEAAPGPRSFLRLEGGHNDAIFRSAAQYERGLAGFLDRVVPQR